MVIQIVILDKQGWNMVLNSSKQKTESRFIFSLIRNPSVPIVTEFWDVKNFMKFCRDNTLDFLPKITFT